MAETRADQLRLGAIVFAQSNDHVTARALVDFYQFGGESVEEEEANEILLSLVADGCARELGPGVYAWVASSSAAPMEHPIFSEDVPTCH